MKIVRKFNFEAAHFIPGHPTCGTLHGHSFCAEVEVSGDLDKYGMLIDYGDLKDGIQPIINVLDHKNLNEILEYPTSENIILFILEHARKKFDNISRIRLSETTNNYAEWVA